MPKWVYSFGPDGSEGNREMQDILGSKGANLAEMSRLGMPVPPGFIVSCEMSRYFKQHAKYPQSLSAEIKAAMDGVARISGKKFGDPRNPLLLSVRSAGLVSMPGMLDTILNIGLSRKTIQGLLEQTGDQGFVYDCYRRLIQKYSEIVMQRDVAVFDEMLFRYKMKHNRSRQNDMSGRDWQNIAEIFEEYVRYSYKPSFPDDPNTQLWHSIRAILNSWHNPRAITYRNIHKISEDTGLAVIIQAMVFGNLGKNSASGVVMTRNPSTGAAEFYGEYLPNIQGEDIVSGIRTPFSITKSKYRRKGMKASSLEETMPQSYALLRKLGQELETRYGDMQDIEFTIENEKLWFLQTRSASKTGRAAIKIAVDMVDQGLLSKQEAVLRIKPEIVQKMLYPEIDPAQEKEVIATGLPASPGAACGVIAFNAKAGEDFTAKGKKFILVRPEMSSNDIQIAYQAQGILTTKGGMTSHAAVVARAMGRPCVTAVDAIVIDPEKECFVIGERVFHANDTIAIDGSTGHVIAGEVCLTQSEMSEDFHRLLSWADEIRRLQIRVNVNSAQEAGLGFQFGAEGIGFCCTENMFFDDERRAIMQELLLASGKRERRNACGRLLPSQREDFTALLKLAKGKPVCIRLLDPSGQELRLIARQSLENISRKIGISVKTLQARLSRVTDTNPVLGHRGCRIGISYPDIYQTQLRAIFEADIAARKQTRVPANVEILIPFVCFAAEFQFIKTYTAQIAEQIKAETNQEIQYKIGAMIELPNAALCAGELAKSADFFSFGMIDMLQTTLGMSRDDIGHFIDPYKRHNLLTKDPFSSAPQESVCELIELGARRGRNTRKDLVCCIAGEFGGDPATIHFCEKNDFDYVSCAPCLVPVARLVAAQSCLQLGKWRAEKHK